MRSLAITTLYCLVYFSYGQLVLEKLPDQLIGREGSFDDVVLSDYVSEESFFEIEFLPPETLDVRPDWSLNAENFQFEMNVTATVKSKGKNTIGDSHLLALIASDGSLRSVGSGIKVENEWVYFLTVYSNMNAENLQFVFFDDSISQIINGNESIVFESNNVLGEPDDPYIIEFNNIRFDLEGEVLSFLIEDINFIGDENLLITARNLADPTDFKVDTVTVSVSDDYTPKLNGAPNQVSNFGNEFTSFDLDDFTQLKDNDLVSFSFSGNNELLVSIDNENLVTITKPNQWSGMESITFVVTDQSDNGFSSNQLVSFVGKPQDIAPTITAITDQTTGIGGFFERISLDDFIVSSNTEAIKWNIEFITDSTVVAPEWTVNANNFQFDMSVTTKVNSLGKRLEGTEHILAAFGSDGEIAGATNAISVDGEWFFFLTINSNIDKDSIYFKVFDATTNRILPTENHVFFQANEVLGDPLDPVEIEAGYLFAEIDQSELSFRLRNATWDGMETIRLTAIDTATVNQLSDSDTIQFEVLNILPPILEGIEDQIIEEGSAFNSIDLSTFLKNLTLDDVSVEIVGADTLRPVLSGGAISFTIPNSDYFGKELLEIKVRSNVNQNLADLVKVFLTVNNVNDAPIITTTPLVTSSIGDLYQYTLQVEDPDFDALTFTSSELPSWLYFVPNQSGGILLGIPTVSAAGEYTIILEASDGLKVVRQVINLVVSLAKIDPINQQVIDEGNTFQIIDLDDFLNVKGQIDTYWEVSTESELIINLNDQNQLEVQTPNEDWFGEEVISVKLFEQTTDNLLDETTIVYEVSNINDAPEFLSNPSTDVDAKSQLKVKTLVEDADGDLINYSLVDAPDWIDLFSEVDGFTLFGIPELESEIFTFDVIANDGTTQSSMTIQIEVSLLLGADNTEQLTLIYPNPTNTILNIASSAVYKKIIVLDHSGKQVMSVLNGQEILDVSSLKRGIYFLKIDEKDVLKFIKM